ncbi:MAG: DUF2927 domain-containing protein [Pseudomonadota bacterium]
MTGRRWVLRALGLVCALFLAACEVAAPPPDVAPEVARTSPVVVRTFGAANPVPPQRSNADMARDFLDLTFSLETGAELPVFTRLDGPLTVATTGVPSAALDRELDLLLRRLRSEARLDITETDDAINATITIEAIARREMNRMVPSAACFILPARTTWTEFQDNPRQTRYLWSRLATRDAVTIFIPVDTSHQEIRDCLHEEVAQGLGPLNDLYRLGDTVFNDDNINAVLTGFDMLMLRVAYHPRLQSGMTQSQVAAELPRIFRSLNPRGERVPDQPLNSEPREWTNAINRALSGNSSGKRRAAADTALAEAERQGWTDVRAALSHYTVGRLYLNRDLNEAASQFISAYEIYVQRPDTALHAANVARHLTVVSLRTGEWDTALLFTDRYVPVAKRHQDAALLADLMMARTVALRATGKPYETTRDEALGWGVYAFGSVSEAEMRARRFETLARASGT